MVYRQLLFPVGEFATKVVIYAKFFRLCTRPAVGTAGRGGYSYTLVHCARWSKAYLEVNCCTPYTWLE